MGDKWSLRWTQSAAKNGAQYLVVTGDRLEAKSTSAAESYTVSIRRKGEDTGIEAPKAENGFTIADGTLIATKGTTAISIHTLDGRTVAISKGSTIDITMLPTGIYMATAEKNDNRETFKIVIRK